MSAEAGRDVLAKALAEIDPRWDAAHTERALAALHQRRARRRATTVLSGAVLLVALSALGAWAAAPGVSRVEEESRSVASTSPRPTEVTPPARPDSIVRLADGSRVIADDGAQVVVEHVTDALIGLRVDRGGARIEVVPGLARRFEVSAGAVTVTVLGTVFRVERLDDTRARVSVERGRVDVAWAGGHAVLAAGDDGVFPAPGAEVEPSAEAGPVTVPSAEASGLAIEPSAEPRASRERTRAAHDPSVSASRPSWRDLARASRFEEAYAALGPPEERARVVSDAVEDLLLAADVARRSGHPAEALPWLEAVERDHPSDSRAVLATFTRGRISMELGRPAEAASHLERALAMEPGGSLAEDALARAAIARAAAGDHVVAAALADRYQSSHPNGRWARRVRAIATRDAPPNP